MFSGRFVFDQLFVEGVVARDVGNDLFLRQQ